MRRALIVDHGTGAETLPVLARYGFAAPARAANLEAALERIAREDFDLAILPLHEATDGHFAVLEAETQRGPRLLLIGTAPVADPQLILRAMRSGVREFLTAPVQAAELALALDRLLRRRTGDQQGRVLPVFSAKGGLGTTSVALNLAHALARRSGADRVALADLVPDGGDLRVMLNLDPVYDILDAVAKLPRMDAQLLASLFAPAPDGLLVLAASDSFERDERLDGDTMHALLGHLRANYPYIVMDCEHHMSERTIAAFDAADQVVLVTQLSVAALRSARHSMALAGRLGYPEDKFCIVVNRHQSDEVLGLRDAVEALGRPVFWSIPNDYRTSLLAQNKGAPVATVASDSKLAASYAQLAAKLGGDEAGQHQNGSAPKATGRLRHLLGLNRKG